MWEKPERGNEQTVQYRGINFILKKLVPDINQSDLSNKHTLKCEKKNKLCGLRLSVKTLLVCFPVVAVAAANDGKSLDEAVTVFAFCSAAACPSAAFGCFAHVGRKSAVCAVLPLLIPPNVVFTVAVVAAVAPVELVIDFAT